eukprot:7627720-Ditylum_brightwellii.AAC.1
MLVLDYAAYTVLTMLQTEEPSRRKCYGIYSKAPVTMLTILLQMKQKLVSLKTMSLGTSV